MPTFLAFALAVTALAKEQDHEACPMHKVHQAEVDHRHEAITGVPSDGTEHHFALAKDGGSIRLEAKDTTRTEARDRARGHLRQIARAFANGDFAMPMQIHDQVPPGVEVMKSHAAAISYRYADSARGGIVTIRTADAEALVAVHEFLRFQITDHGTGDPTLQQ
jgi:hypothetical protein